MKRVISAQTLGRAEDITSYLLNARAYAHDKSQTKLQWRTSLMKRSSFTQWILEADIFSRSSSPNQRNKIMVNSTSGRSRAITLRGVYHPTITFGLTAAMPDMNDPFLLSKPLKRQVQIISERMISGWTADQAFGFAASPPQAAKAQSHPISCDGKTFTSIKAMAIAYNAPVKLVFQRLRREKWPAEAAVGITSPPYRLPVLTGDVAGSVYTWEHIRSGRRYIGQTIHLGRRKGQHLLRARKGKHLKDTFHSDLKRFGQKAFKFYVLEGNIPRQHLASRERDWIKFHNSKSPCGYNQNSGGVSGKPSKAMQIAGSTYQSIQHASQVFNIHPSRLAGRLKRGWSVEEAIGLEPRQPQTHTPLFVNLGGGETEFLSIAAACRYWHFNYKDILNIRNRNNVSWAEAIRIAFVS